jgi:hypothetical protein
MARALTPEAIQALGEIMRDKSAPAAARVSPATAILDRAYGKPAQTVHANVARSAVDLSDEELIAIIQAGGSEPEAVH